MVMVIQEEITVARGKGKTPPDGADIHEDAEFLGTLRESNIPWSIATKGEALYFFHPDYEPVKYHKGKMVNVRNIT